MPRRIEGEIKLTMPHAAHHTMSLDAHNLHTWMGVSPSARVEVTLDHPQLSFTGQAYHDSNWGEAPLEDAFSFWTWSRASLSEGTLVVYDVTDKHTSERVERALLFHERGGVTELNSLQKATLKRGGWGVRRETRADHTNAARLCHALVDAPFYTRDVIEVEFLGQTCLAVHEALDLERFTRPWVRFLIPFRVRRL
jgi:carotenoid 1,2-hydratase